MTKKKNLPKTIKNVLIKYMIPLYCYSCLGDVGKQTSIQTPPNPKSIIDPKIQEIIDKLLKIEGKPFEELLDEYIKEHPEDKDYCEENKESIKFMFNLQNPPSPQTPPSPPPQPVPQKKEKKNKEIVDELKDKELEDKIEKYKEPQPEERKKFVDDNKEEIKEEYKKQQEEKKKICPKCKKNPCECKDIDVDKLFDESEWLNKIKDKKEEIEKLKKGVKDIFQFLKNIPDDEFGLKKNIQDNVDNMKNRLSKIGYNNPDPIERLKVSKIKIKNCNNLINSYSLRKRIYQFSKSQNISYGKVNHTMNIEDEFNRIAEEVANENPSQWTKGKALRWLKYKHYISSYFIAGYNDGDLVYSSYDDGKTYDKKLYNSYEEQYKDKMDGFISKMDTYLNLKNKADGQPSTLFDGFDKSKVAQKILENVNKHKGVKLPEVGNGSRCYFSLDGNNWHQMLEANPNFSNSGKKFDVLWGLDCGRIIYDREQNSYHCCGNMSDEKMKQFWNAVKWNDVDGCFEVK